jgi:hypothetical protein
MDMIGGTMIAAHSMASVEMQYASGDVTSLQPRCNLFFGNRPAFKGLKGADDRISLLHHWMERAIRRSSSLCGCIKSNHLSRRAGGDGW